MVASNALILTIQFPNNTLLGKNLFLERASPAALPDNEARIDQPRCMEDTRVSW